MEKFEFISLINVILLLAFIYILYEIFKYIKKVKGSFIAFFTTIFLLFVITEGCDSDNFVNLQDIVNESISKKEIRKKYKIFKLEQNHSFLFLDIHVGYLLYFDDGKELRIFDEQVNLSGLTLGTNFDETPESTGIMNYNTKGYKITSSLRYNTFFYHDKIIVSKIFTSDEIKKASLFKGVHHFNHYPKIKDPEYSF